ncbi:MAG TPA: hypothetical protein VK116_07880, partial [Planctomycetota bacterium]|nr:hypothetical protein [Planctomycetota bacterium]
MSQLAQQVAKALFARVESADRVRIAAEWLGFLRETLEPEQTVTLTFAGPSRIRGTKEPFWLSEYGELPETLVRWGSESEEVFRFLFSEIARSPIELQGIVHESLKRRLDALSPATVRLLAEQEMSALETFLGRLWLGVPTPSPGLSDSNDGPGFAEKVAALLARNHPDERLRALALTYEAALGGAWHEVYARDPNPVVRRTCLRLAALLGDPPSFRLSELVLAEEDPEALVDLIEALTVAHGRSAGDAIRGFEVSEGRYCGWITARGDPSPWTDEEIARLESLLRTRSEPALRDACSFALASAHRVARERTGSPPSALDLRVHEWGVFRDRGTAFFPEFDALEALPSFIHRHTIHTNDLISQRTEATPAWISGEKPVVFFHGSTPRSLLVRVGFRRGHPWACHPAPTDLLQRGAFAPQVDPQRFSVEVPSSGAIDADGNVFAPVSGINDLSPPWELFEEVSSQHADEHASWSEAIPLERRGVWPAKGELRERYRLAGWLWPNHPPTSSIVALGLEWCGLRVGYDDRVEPAMEPVSETHWWARCREVPSRSIAIRGERERFLFYEGGLGVPGPVVATWEDSTRERLWIGLRSFSQFSAADATWGTLRGNAIAVDEHAAGKSSRAPFPALFVVRGGESPRGTVLEELWPEEGPWRIATDDLPLEGAALVERFAAALLSRGLEDAEARSLIESFREELFERRGARVLAVIPQWLYDFALPMEILPVPGELVRVGVVLLDSDRIGVALRFPELVPWAERWTPRSWPTTARVPTVVFLRSPSLQNLLSEAPDARA